MYPCNLFSYRLAPSFELMPRRSDTGSEVRVRKNEKKKPDGLEPGSSEPRRPQKSSGNCSQEEPERPPKTPSGKGL